MNRPTASDIREMPLYSAAEVGRFLHLPASTERTWAFGQGCKAKSAGRRSGPMIGTADRKGRRLWFLNLVELLVLVAIRRHHNVPLQKVRRALNYWKKQSPGPQPLADHQFQTDGLDSFIEKCSKLLNLSRGGHLATKELIQAHLRPVEGDASGGPFKLHLPGADKVDPSNSIVVIDPRFGFGRPVLDIRGVRTEVIVERFQAGETMASLAGDYELPAAVIEDVIRNHLPLAA